MKWFVIKEKMICAELNKLEDGEKRSLPDYFGVHESTEIFLSKKWQKSDRRET